MADLFAGTLLVLLLIILLVDAFFLVLFQRILGVFIVVVAMVRPRRGEIHGFLANCSATATFFTV